MGSLSKSLCQRSSTAILPIETLTGILYRDVLQRSYQEMLFRPCTEIVGRDLPQSSWRREPGSLAQAVEDILTKGSCTASSAEILPRRSCPRSFTGIFTKGTCRIYPGISSSCSLQHCLVPIAGTWIFEINYVCLLVDLLTSAYVLFSSSSWACLASPTFCILLSTAWPWKRSFGLTN